jgi:hypothetical protein
LLEGFEAAGNGGFLFGVSSARSRSCSSTSYVNRVNDLALVDNGPLTSVAVFRAAARRPGRAESGRCPDSIEILHQSLRGAFSFTEAQASRHRNGN